MSGGLAVVRASAANPGRPFQAPPGDLFREHPSGFPEIRAVPAEPGPPREEQRDQSGRGAQRERVRGRSGRGLRVAGGGDADARLVLDASCLLQVPDTSPTFPARVFAKVDASGDCWEWTGAINPNGYGTVGRGGRGAGNIAAHRAVWELLVGPIAPGMHYDHLCRNRRCVNPDHGEIVEPAENKRRGYSPAVLYGLRTMCDHGHPLDGMTGGRGSARRHRYCKTCAREKTRLRREAERRAA